MNWSWSWKFWRRGAAPATEPDREPEVEYPTIRIECRGEDLYCYVSWPPTYQQEEAVETARVLARTAFLLSTGELSVLIHRSIGLGGDYLGEPQVASMAQQMLANALVGTKSTNQPMVLPLAALGVSNTAQNRNKG